MHCSLSMCPQESFLAPKFKQIVQYCQRKDTTKEGLLALLEEAAGQKNFHVNDERQNPRLLVLLFIIQYRELFGTCGSNSTSVAAIF